MKSIADRSHRSRRTSVLFPVLVEAGALAWALAPAVLAEPSPREVDSALVAATVYLDRAVLTRTATVALGEGTHALAFAGLPASLDERSLRVSGRGTARATILDVQAHPVWLEAAPDARVRGLEEQLEALQWELRALDDRRAGIERQVKLLDAIGAAATAAPGQETTGGALAPRAAIEDWRRLLEFSAEGFAALTAQRQEADRERDGVQRRIAVVQQQLGQLRGAGARRQTKRVTVRVASETAGDLELALSYTVPDARWEPAYDARYDAAERRVSLGYFGVVRQATGADWRDIELTLSTARPSLGGAAPELRPWVLDQMPPPALPMRMDSFAGRERAIAAAAPMDDSAGESAVHQQAAVETRATSATFRVPARASIPSDNAPHRVGIATVPLAATPLYRTTPKLQPAAFLSAKVRNESAFPLLAGPMAVFLDDTFVAQAALRTVMPGEEFDLALGADEGIRVERTLRNRLTEDLGLVRRETRVTYDVLIAVHNLKRTPERVVVRDQVPVSRFERIAVALDAALARQLQPDAEGVVEWTLDLRPGERRELPLKFSVTHPRDLAVIGLE